IALPGTKERMEVPLWQLTDVASHGKAKKTALQYAEYRNQYAKVKLDGLPVRAEPINTAKQVYRLRKGEIVKLLYKGDGQKVMAGSTELEGDWLRILANDGTQGWCFSYNLDQFQTERGSEVQTAEVEVEEELTDESLDAVLAKVWYPEYYRSMIDSNQIDISMMNAAYAFFVDVENEKISLNLPNVVFGTWAYKGAKKTGSAEYTFTDAPIKIILKNDTYIVVTYTNEQGRPQELNFITLAEEENVAELVAMERLRRSTAYQALYRSGPDFVSESYGQLSLKTDQSFSWRNYRLLVPSVIEESARGNGIITVKYFLNESLASSYDGVLTFRFDNMNKDVNFLYKIEADGIRFEDASKASYSGNMITSRALSPLVLFFQKR
ncbi:MAG: SH3 domain-containing protein, partial [Treponema sp.]|nr:SH3 domain-containing protein [Treponema sp.]